MKTVIIWQATGSENMGGGCRRCKFLAILAKFPAGLLLRMRFNADPNSHP